MAEFPCLPLWTDALAADTDHLSHEEFGLYVRMLTTAWRMSGCTLPNDEKWLCRRFRLDSSQVEMLRCIIADYWHTDDAGRLYQKRLSREHEMRRDFSRRQSERAKSRWNKDSDVCGGNAGPHASGNATPSPSPSPSPSLNPTLNNQPKNNLDAGASPNGFDDGREQPPPEPKARNGEPYAFIGNTIKLTQADYTRLMRQGYKIKPFAEWLAEYDELISCAPDAKRTWWHRLPKAIKAEQQRRKSQERRHGAI